jgi:hypothetical protein
MLLLKLWRDEEKDGGAIFSQGNIALCFQKWK